MSEEAVIKPIGDLLGEEVIVFKKKILEVLATGVERIIVDMQGVQVIDSTGIGVLVASKNSAEENNCDIVLKNLNSDIMKMFKIMRLNEHFIFLK